MDKLKTNPLIKEHDQIASKYIFSFLDIGTKILVIFSYNSCEISRLISILIFFEI